MKEPRVLLAKRPKNRCSPQEPETLIGHTQATLSCFHLMFGTKENSSRLAERWLHFFGLEAGADEFQTNGSVACVLHDMGKANSGFQRAVTGNPDSQVVRHEHLSGLILALPGIRDMLVAIPQLCLEVVLCATIGHHLRVDRASFGRKLSADLDTFSICTGGIARLLELAAGDQQLALASTARIPEVWSFKRAHGHFDLIVHRDQVIEALARFRRRLVDERYLLRLLVAVRAALIAADSAASGLMREGEDIEAWLRYAFSEDAVLGPQAVADKVIGPRIEQIARRHGRFQWQGFQDAAEALPERALVVAPCGSGKTLAAWRWIKGQVARKPTLRVMFLYPTRGTATEGFRDYVSWAPEADAALIHGTSAFELDGMFQNCSDPREGKDFTTDDRLFALAYWQRRIFSATIDQFLGFMQHAYRSVCLMPLLADSAVVFDEVHSFDRNLFSALKRFLKEFNVPVLCMTASLPINRRQELEQCGLTLFPEDLQDFPDLQSSAGMPRYRVHGLAGEHDARAVMVEALAAGKRVLWVVNTVGRCQSLAMELGTLCYHSRFKLEDRQVHHNRVIGAFKSGGDGLVAVTIQVCEMSLDLDADVLITETAPITSLIQRMGRCNRHSLPADNRLGAVYVYPPRSRAPYEETDLTGVDQFMQALVSGPVSQSQLVELLERFSPAAVEPERYAAFLESGPWALAREESLREQHEFTKEAILDVDVETYMSLRKQRKPVDGLVISVPRRHASPDSRTAPFSIAPSSHYSTKYGFFDSPVEAGDEQGS